MPPSACSQPTKALPLADIATTGLRSAWSSPARMTCGADQVWPGAVRTDATACMLKVVGICSSHATMAAPFAFIDSTGLTATVVVIEIGVVQVVPLLDVLCQTPWSDEPVCRFQTAR